jgi:peptidoglycan/LPS O-acetylase OafA/YrhL
MVLATGLSLGVMLALGDPAAGSLAEMPFRQIFSTVFLLGYAELPVRPVGPAWSLDVEMQFYLLAPPLIILVRRTSAIIALGLAYVAHLAGMAIYPGVVLTSFLPFFVIGMVAAQHDWRVPEQLANGALAAAIALTVAIQVSPWQPLLLGGDSEWWPSLNLVLAALAFPQALLSATTRGGKHDGICADQSYIVYMLHWPAILVWRGLEPATPLQSTMLFIALCVAVASCAWLTRWLLDQPLNRARARWVEARRPFADGTGQLPEGAKGDDSTRVFA